MPGLMYVPRARSPWEVGFASTLPQLVANLALMKIGANIREKEARAEQIRRERTAAKAMVLKGQAVPAERIGRNVVQLGGMWLKPTEPYSRIEVGGTPAILTRDGKVVLQPQPAPVKPVFLKGAKRHWMYDPTKGTFIPTPVKTEEADGGPAKETPSSIKAELMEKARKMGVESLNDAELKIMGWDRARIDPYFKQAAALIAQSLPKQAEFARKPPQEMTKYLAEVAKTIRYQQRDFKTKEEVKEARDLGIIDQDEALQILIEKF